MDFIDQLGRTVSLRSTPQRIVSLVPSQTELLYDLGLDAEVVGITKFCIHPEQWFKNKTRIGGTKTPHIEKIISLNPDLIIANKEENTLEAVNELSKYAPVWVSDIKNIEDATAMIFQIGKITGKAIKTKKISDTINHSFNEVKGINKQSFLYLIWNNPIMAAGVDTFSSFLLEFSGMKNELRKIQFNTRYPEINTESLDLLNPEIVFLSSEPFPFDKKHLSAFERIFPNAKIILADGELLSWYGSRLQKTPSYLKDLLQGL